MHEEVSKTPKWWPFKMVMTIGHMVDDSLVKIYGIIINETKKGRLQKGWTNAVGALSGTTCISDAYARRMNF